MIIDPADFEVQDLYKLLVGSVVPRPIAWTSTMSPDGIRNLAPFSFFAVASRKPSVLTDKNCSRIEFKALLTESSAELELRR